MLLPRQLGGETVKVLDFGLAKMLDSARNAQDITPTAAGTIVGTLAYMAPEQFTGHASPRSDIYAVGTLLYAMLVGNVPFRGDNLVDYVNLHRFASAPPFPEHLDVAPEIEQVVLEALEKCPEDRHPSALAMHEALRLVRDTATDTIDVSNDDVVTVTPLSQQVPHMLRQTVLELPRWKRPAAELPLEAAAAETPLAELSVGVDIVEHAAPPPAEAAVSAELPPTWVIAPVTAIDPEIDDALTLSDTGRDAVRMRRWGRILLAAALVLLITIAWRVGLGWCNPPKEARQVKNQAGERAGRGVGRSDHHQHRMLFCRPSR